MTTNDFDRAAENPQSNTDPAPQKSIFLRDLPKPVTKAFVAVLVLSVVIPGIYTLFKRENDRKEAEARAVEQDKRRIAYAEDHKLRKQLKQQRFFDTQQVSETVFVPVERIIDPVLDEMDFGEVTPQELTRWIQMEPSLLQRRNEIGWTLAHALAYYGRDDLIRVLIESKGRVTAVDDAGLSPLHVVSIALNKGLIESSRSISAARLLLAAGADPNLDAPGIGTPTELAAQHPSKPLLSLMEKHGSKLEQDVPRLLTRPVAPD